jgi:pyruvate-formate lyase-activating enzyme
LRDLSERMDACGRRVHISAGVVCNNNCVFCMEDDRAGRSLANAATSDETVAAVLAGGQDCEEICFTSGEPTTNPRLVQWVRMARRAGIPQLSLMTNGRLLSYHKLTRELVDAGLNRVYVSIHGHTARLHDGLTRTPGSFTQTVAGLDAVTSYKQRGVSLHTSTVLTRRNLPHLGDLHRFLQEHGADQVVFNASQGNTRAFRQLPALFPTYAEIAAAAERWLMPGPDTERTQAFLVDIPWCTTTRLPDSIRGFLERRLLAVPPGAPGPDGAPVAAEGHALVYVDNCAAARTHRRKQEACGGCRYDAICDGVWADYLDRHGWGEFSPVAR